MKIQKYCKIFFSFYANEGSQKVSLLPCKAKIVGRQVKSADDFIHLLKRQAAASGRSSGACGRRK